MELGLIDKMKIIFQSLFSSFMFIEIFLFFFLLFLLVVFNIKIKNKVVPIVLSIFGIGKLKNSQPTKLLTCKISPPKSSASTGFNMTRM